MATSVLAPMVGQIIKVLVKPGDKVNENDTIATIEAMKIEMPIAAPVSGTIKEIKVSEGQTVEADMEIAIIE